MFGLSNRKNNFYLLGIIFLAIVLRFYKLGFQSLWLDELYTMIESDPEISWAETKRLVVENECKSPVYYFLVKLFCQLFGYTEFVARSVSALGGVISVYAIYWLGRELSGIRVGLVAAALTCINPFHIYYSQEARGYIFLFLFATLSYLFFVRTLRSGKYKSALAHGITTLLALHIHPFAALVPASQLILIAVFFFSKQYKAERLAMFKKFLLSYLILLIGFFPLVGDFQTASKITDFWVPKPAQSYFIDFFYEFFGNSDLLKPLLLTGLIAYLVEVFRAKEEQMNYGGSSFNFSIFSISLVIIFLIPYLYSILKVPATVSRYFISALPLLILTLSIGLSAIESKLTRNILLLAFVLISLTDLVVIRRYYFEPAKTQFREMTEYVKYYSDQPYLINNQKTPWHTDYYIKRSDIQSKITGMDKEVFVDSVMAAKTDKSFWLIGAHQDPKLSSEKARLLETRFVLTKSKDFIDAWAQLYRPVNDGKKVLKKLDFTHFNKKNVDKILGDSVVTLWDGEARISLPVSMPAGNYVLKLNCSGTPYKNIYPHLNVYKNEVFLGSYYTDGSYGFSPPFNFDVMSGEGEFVLRVSMDNDENNAITNEDRNAFIKSVYFFKD